MILTLNEIVEQLRNQKVIAYPTESVFGLGCDPDSEIAVNQLLHLKNRSVDKGLILIAANYQQLLPYVDDVQLDFEQRLRLEKSWPGHVTWVMPALESTPFWLTGQFNTLAVRVSAHPLVQQLCFLFGKALVSTSANLSGEPACRTADEVIQQFGERLPILDGVVGGLSNPSEIRSLATNEVIRKG